MTLHEGSLEEVEAQDLRPPISEGALLQAQAGAERAAEDLPASPQYSLFKPLESG